MAIGDPGTTAPYAPASAVVSVIEHAREKGLTTPVTRVVLERVGVGASLSKRTLAALKTLDLIDADGELTPTMEKIRVAPSSEFQAVLADWVRDAYKQILAYVEPTTDVARITDQFRHYEPPGMRNRMVTLFLGLSAYAGLVDKVPPMPRANSRVTTVAGRDLNGNRFGPKKLAQHKPVAKKAAQRQVLDKPDPPAPPTMTEAHARYVDMLMDKANALENPPDELLDRIERALGIASAEKGADP